MSIVLDENILGIWYCQLADDYDIMWSLRRIPEGGYKAVGRTRKYYTPDDPWDDKDTKRWFEGPVPGDNDDAAVERSRDFVMKITGSFTARFHPDRVPVLFELVRGSTSVEDFAKKLQSMPWAHSMEAKVH
jgi:hypothetical protein